MSAPVRGEPRLASAASWAVLGASFILSAATWIDLARLAGFSHRIDLHVMTADLAWLMPVAVDGYVVVALVLWMSPVPAAVADFARKNTYAAAGIGIAAQSVYHALDTATAPGTPLWQSLFAAVVGALPPAVAGLAVHMRALIRRHCNEIREPAVAVTPAADLVTSSAPEPVQTPMSPAPLPTGPRVPAGFLPAPSVNGNVFGGAQ